MTRDDIEKTILTIMEEEFEIVNPDQDANLTEKYEFDSIDALETLSQVEQQMGVALTMDQKKKLFDYRTINQICDYLASLLVVDAARSAR
jgi:acyl carrier protein